MDEKTKTKLSTFMTKILRHSPEKFGVVLDERGACTITELLSAINRDSRWKDVKKEVILDIVKTCTKQRFKIEGEKIKARYGHSIPVIQENTKKEIPKFLYHGTNLASLKSIVDRKEGILPMKRQYVHLSETKDFATLAAKRRKNPYILKVDTQIAKENKTHFFFAGNEVWLSTEIPTKAIIEIDELNF